MSQESGSTTDTNPDNEFVKEMIKCCSCEKLSLSLQLCGICKVGLKSKGALAFHLKQCHPESRLYHCDSCNGAYNTRADLASH